MNGKLKPVPDHLCSDAMVEWGQVPSGFELLSSETVVAVEGEGEAEGAAAEGGALRLERTFLRMLPETG